MAALPRRRLLASAAAAASALAIGGCGFRLRGVFALPFETLWVGFPPTSPTGAEFRRALRANTATRIVERPDQAQARMEVLGETQERQIVTFSPTGRPREYELRLRIVYRVVDAAGTVLTPPTELVLKRVITVADTDLTSKQHEEALLYRDMQVDVSQQLLRRLSSIKAPMASAPAAARPPAR
ncbi:MAG TPA: LPS assembly lipoprotein LptE [Burkholderiaceae bacterium]|nr:LPS assembly lipoprotein LptE [Burkholderiaceae bacterium]